MKCRHCGGEVLSNRHGNSRYCCDDHEKAARKLRSKLRYGKLSSLNKEIERCQAILQQVYLIQSLKKPILGRDLKTLGFNFSLSTNEHLENGKLCKVVGNYAYHLDQNENLSIWKLKSKK